MKDRIIRESIESLRQEGLKFSVDTLADKLRISKKTVYKYFRDKEALALALYETYYTNATERAKKLISDREPSVYLDLLQLYFDSKMMIRSEIFNKYKLN
ncbi:MAG: TetR/AcrR family transcriptional regulator [Acutalibacteraceae bacterium]